MTLTAEIKKVGCDVYELRMVRPSKAVLWAVRSVQVSSQDRIAGVNPGFEEAGGLIRARIAPANSLEVNWSVHLENGE